jgi:hypothetical protein
VSRRVRVRVRQIPELADPVNQKPRLGYGSRGGLWEVACGEVGRGPGEPAAFNQQTLSV